MLLIKNNQAPLENYNRASTLWQCTRVKLNCVFIRYLVQHNKRERKRAMDISDIQLQKLKPIHVASAHAYSESPETDAWNKLCAWAKPLGLLDTPGKHRIFGFNNPNPSAGSTKYGYEFWITVAPEIQPSGDIVIKDFPGGLYLTAKCNPGSGEDIARAWKDFAVWFENSKHKHANHQWLEEHIYITPAYDSIDNLELKLYLPVSE
jgi:AraC family transcriptional regulator